MVLKAKEGIASPPYRGSGDLTLTNNITFEGNVVGSGNVALSTLIMSANSYSANAAIATSGLNLITAADDRAFTLANPGIAGKLLVIYATSVGGSKSFTVTTATAAALDGTNNTATFDATHEALVLISVSATKWLIISNVGTVGLSAVA